MTADKKYLVNRYVDLSDAFQLLAIGLSCPDKDLSAALLDGTFYQDLTNCLKCLDCGVIHTFKASIENTDRLYHQLNIEYTRLFTSPDHPCISPYEGIYLNKKEGNNKPMSMFINNTALHAEQTYRKAGFPYTDRGTLPGDHIRVELMFVSYLYTTLAQAAQNDTSGSAVPEQMITFYNTHINKWMISFFMDLNNEAQIGFYKDLAQTGLILVSELALFSKLQG